MVGRGVGRMPKKGRPKKKREKKRERGERKEEKKGIKRERKLNQSFQEHVVIGLWKPPDRRQRTSDL